MRESGERGTGEEGQGPGRVVGRSVPKSWARRHGVGSDPVEDSVQCPRRQAGVGQPSRPLLLLLMMERIFIQEKTKRKGLVIFPRVAPTLGSVIEVGSDLP